MIIPTIMLENVQTRKLKTRINGYDTLFQSASHSHLLKVRGVFANEKGELAFLQHQFFTVDMEKSGSVWLYIQIDNEWSKMRADRDIIDQVQISVFQK